MTSLKQDAPTVRVYAKAACNVLRDQVFHSFGPACSTPVSPQPGTDAPVAKWHVLLLQGALSIVSMLMPHVHLCADLVFKFADFVA